VSITPSLKPSSKAKQESRHRKKERYKGCRRGVGGEAEVVSMADGNGGW